MQTAPDEYLEFARSQTPNLYRLAYLLTGERGLAENLVRDVLAHLRRDWRRLPADGAVAHARRTLYRLYLSVWGSRWWAESPPGYTLDRPEPGVPHDPVAAALRASVRQAMHGLYPKHRATLIARVYEGCSEEEAADLLGMSRRAVRKQTSWVVDRLHRFVPELDHPTDPLRSVLAGIAETTDPSDLLAR